MNIKSTDIDRNFSDYKDDPEQGWDCIKLFAVVVVMLVAAFTLLSIVFGRIGFWDNI